MTAEARRATRGVTLLEVARSSLEDAFGLACRVPAREGWLCELGASFVTLTLEGALRGCVGTVRAARSIYDDVWDNARAAAFRDDRFHPLTVAELPMLVVEVSMLSPLEPCRGEEELRHLLRPGRDGVVLEFGACRSTFLPQVWEQLQEMDDFLAHLKRKAGLDARFTHPELRFWRYSVDKWCETLPDGSRLARGER